MRRPLIGLSVLFFLVLTGCVPQSSSAPTPTQTEGIPRWVLYERGLSDILLGPPNRTNPDLTVGHGLCEWELLGQKDNEVYVWALCTIYDQSIGTATSAPAVIRFADDGSIIEVEMPHEGWDNVRELFPQDIADRILSHKVEAHADWGYRLAKRLVDPSLLPLIVEQGAQLP